MKRRIWTTAPGTTRCSIGRRVAVAVLLSVLLGTAAGNPRSERYLNVMTFNIHHGEAPGGAASLDEMARLIARHEVDVVALQEVDRHWSNRSAYADQVEELAARLGMYAFFGPIYDLPSAEPGRPNRMYGLALLSRFPIVEGRNNVLTRLPTVGSEARTRLMPGFPMIAIDVDGVVLQVYNTHLDYRGDPSVRRQQVAETVALLAEETAPRVLMGDLNAPPEAPELAPLLDLLVDAWRVRGAGDGFTYPADEPVRRIDYILTSPDVRVESVRVVETTASDHRPVVARITLPM